MHTAHMVSAVLCIRSNQNAATTSISAPDDLTFALCRHMQANGNVLITDYVSNIVWQTNTAGQTTNNYNSFLRMQEDGNLVVYK
jgi:hypothetical protein